MQKKLIDQSNRNSLLNFKLSSRSNTHICVIDELPEKIYEKISQNQKLEFKSLPPPNKNDGLPDEETREFKSLLHELRETDFEYKKKCEELEKEKKNSNKENIDEEYKIERWLKDKVRDKLELPKRQENQSYVPKEWARINGLNPNSDLPFPKEGLEKKHDDNYLQTLFFEDDMARKLSSIQRRIKIDREEKGMNTLYMSIGFLHYKEAKNSEKTLLAPLILLQLNITKELKGGKYVFSIYSNEQVPLSNLALKEKLLSDFGIAMPEIDSEDEVNKFKVEKYFEKIQTDVIKNSPEEMDWNLKRIICIGRFSFQKLNMYEDLKEENWLNLEEHPILKKLWKESGTAQRENIPDDVDLNLELNEKNTPCLIDDADSSQFHAVAKALSGLDMIIKGPPGTGKSQTILNIIGSLLNQNKKILFISEKKAALDVVKKRLESSKLGLFCLSVTDKKEVLKSLRERIELLDKPKQAVDENKAQYRDYNNIKKSLIKYKNLMKKPLNVDANSEEGKDLTCFDTIWAYIKNDKSIEEIKDKIPWNYIREQDFKDKRKKSYTELGIILENLESSYKKISKNFGEKVCDWPWYGVPAKFNIGNKIKLDEIKNKSIQYAQCLEKLLLSVNKNNLYLPISIGNISAISSILNEFKDNIKPIKLSKEIFSRLDCSEVYEVLNFILNSQRDILNAKNKHFFMEDSSIKLSKLREKVEKTFEREKYYMREYPRSMEGTPKEYRRLNIFLQNKNKSKTFKFLNFFYADYRQSRKVWEYISEQKKQFRDDNVCKIFNDLSNYMESKHNLISDEFIKGAFNEPKGLEEIDFNLANRIIEWSKRVKDGRFSDNAKSFLLEKEDLSEKWKGLKDIYQSIKLEELEVLFNFYNKLLDKKILNRVNWLFSKFREKDFQCVKNSLSKEKEHRDELASEMRVEFIYKCIDDKNLVDWKNKFDLIKDNMNQYDSYANFCIKWESLQEYGFSNIINSYIKEKKPINYTKEVLGYIFYKTLLKNENLNGVLVSDSDRNRFKEYDKKNIKIGQDKIYSKLKNTEVEVGNNNGPKKDWTELCAIKAELNKKKNIPLRRLFLKASKALLELKPCWIMSPSSVAQYLIPEKFKFDLLIIDEASQMPPEEALGGILRAKQIIVVGDEQQLPPSDYFKTQDEEDEEENIVDEESILDLFNNSNVKFCDLLWHYRSRHEDLIKFSNSEFYDNKLIVFPSPKKRKNLGVEFVYVKQAKYKPSNKSNSSKFSGGINPEEAKMLIEKIIIFMKENKTLSIGIVAMNKRQTELISNEMEQRRASVQDVSDYYEKWKNSLEPPFIKNLENVQGDERDVIFISTVYGPDERTDIVRQNFGPINKNGGYRRLNVLFTRAKRKIFLFSSMQASDIRVDDETKRGVRVLRDYLKFSKEGLLPKQPGYSTDNEPNDFEESVGRVLMKNNFDIKYQYGVAGYKIDIVVKHPKNNDFVLAIECDGASYHSSKSARDRDRLREEVLKGYGWRIYRIWSTDWFEDPKREEEKLIKAIVESIQT